VLCQLSYAPGREDCTRAFCGIYAGAVQRRALGALFGGLAAAFAGLAVAAIAGAGADTGRWLVAAAALALAAWLGSMAVSAFRS
jgi:hypothetical protein